jgi:sulfatase maturation enzyme AslB (radical SAM superfamily)
MNIMSGSLAGYVPPVSTDRLSILSVVLNNLCPLSCRHCYLQPPAEEKTLPYEDWARFIQSAIANLRPEFLCFAGKEVFASTESANLVFESLNIRNRTQAHVATRTQIGIITNGILSERYIERLGSPCPDWIDVSLDGMPAIHDQIRGSGMFERTARQLPSLVNLMGERLWITSTLMATNLDTLPAFVSYVSDRFGIRRFSIGLYKSLPYTDEALGLPFHIQAKNIVNAVLRLDEIGDAKDIIVKLDFDSSHRLLREQFAREGLLPETGILRSTVKRLSNGLSLGISTTDVPVGLWRAARVTHDGRWLAAEDVVDVREYIKRTTGSLREHDFDAVTLYRTGILHHRFKELVGMSLDELRLLADREAGRKVA